MTTVTRKFLWLFLKVSSIGSVISVIGLLNGDSFEYMLLYSLKMIGLSILGFVSIFMGIVYYRFNRLFSSYHSGQSASCLLSMNHIDQYIKQSVQFPILLFRGFLAFGIFYAVFYLLTEWWMNQEVLHYRNWDWAWFLKNLFFKAALVWLLALMLYNGSSKILRPVLSWLQEANPVGLGIRMPIRQRMIGVTMSITVMMGMQYVYLQVSELQSNERLYILGGFFALFLILSYSFTRSAIDDVVADIDQVRSSLAEFNRLEFPQSTQRLKVESADEVGELKVQFNSLQEKAEKYYSTLSQELAMASRVQSSLLPTGSLVVRNIRIEAKSTSAADLGGDFYDLAEMDDQLVVMIGDVAGKGLPAALITATVLGLFRAEVRHGGTPREWLQRMNMSISDVLMPGMFVTVGLLSINCRTGGFQYASAGHLPPIALSNGQLTEWDIASLPLGFGQETSFSEQTGTFSVGDRLILYTDGVLEARSASGSIVGFERLHDWVRRASASSHGFLDEIAASLESHRQHALREDDETIVVVHILHNEQDLPVHSPPA